MQNASAAAQTPTMFDWDDLKYLLAVAQHQSTLAASRALGVNQSTVQRRLAELERRIGRPLVKRLPSGYRLTEFGLELLPHARRVGDAVQALEQRLQAAQRDLSGVVRMTCPEPLVYRITHSTLLERFNQRYPALKVEFVMSDRYLDLGKGEADIALRSGDTDDGELVGRKIGDSIWAVYASRRYAERHGLPANARELQQHSLVAFDETMARHRAAKWLHEVAPDGNVVARNNSVLGLVYAVKSGVGVAPLPTALGDDESDLLRAFGPIPELQRIWRVLAHPERRHAPNVAALFDFIVDETEALKLILTG
jgi:DNA-binding transcriptional LysR family regulator